MNQQPRWKFSTSLRNLIIVLALVAGGIVGVAGPASADTPGDILPPFNTGETWYVYQGYGPNAPTHNNSNPAVASLYGLDLTYGNSTTASAGRTVRAPMSGTVYYYQASYGNLCVNTADGGSYTLTHITSSVTSGAVSAGQAVGAVGAAGSYNNNGVAHIHFQTWSAPGCWANTNGGMPFDSLHGRRICGAPDFTAAGTGSNGVWSGTSFTGAACATSSNTYRVAFRANNGSLYLYGPAGGAVNTTLGIAVNTSPAIIPLSSGYEVVFQAANSGSLYLYNTVSGVATNTTLGMAAGTSPAVARLSNGGYEAAFQDNQGNLWVYGNAGIHNLRLGMAPGTSPAITGLSNGSYEVAFQANSGSLYLYNPSKGATNLALGMASGTSPSIAGLRNGGFEASFQDNQGNLWVYGSAGTHNLRLGMAPGTSPAIAGLVDGTYKVSFQAGGSGSLYLYDPANGAVNTTLGMATGTSPAVAQLSGGGYEAAFQDNQGNLWVYGSAGTHNLRLGMAAGTNPAMG